MIRKTVSANAGAVYEVQASCDVLEDMPDKRLGSDVHGSVDLVR